MSARFGAAARQLAGVACRALGWRPADFWDATPAELAAIFEPEEQSGEASLTRAELQSLMERDGDG